MPDQSTEILLDALVRTIKPILRKHIRPDGCIAASRIIIDALTYFRVYKDYDLEIKPLSVKVMIWNPPLATRIQKEGRFPRNAEERDRWTEEDGSWGIGVGVADTPEEQHTTDWENKKWNGHLVVLVNDILIDLTLDQANRPHHNVNLPEYVVADCRNEYEFLSGIGFLGLSLNDCHVIYDVFTADRSYEVSPNWIGDSTSVYITGQVIRAMKRFLKRREEEATRKPS